MKPQAAGGAEGAVAHRQTAQTQGDVGAAARQLLQGQRVQPRVHEVVHWAGTVETVAALLGMVWIREDGLGERKLLDLREYQVHPQNSHDG